jgi:hypothetical protein
MYYFGFVVLALGFIEMWTQWQLTRFIILLSCLEMRAEQASIGTLMAAA